jgi:hypothetical protein
MAKKTTNPKPAPAKIAPKIAKKPTRKLVKDAKETAAESAVGPKKLDLCLLLDCTGSMGSWI